MRCSKCNSKIIQTGEDGRHKIRAPIVVFSADGQTCEVPCRQCKTTNKIPATLNLRSRRIVVPVDTRQKHG